MSSALRCLQFGVAGELVPRLRVQGEGHRLPGGDHQLNNDLSEVADVVRGLGRGHFKGLHHTAARDAVKKEALRRVVERLVQKGS